MDLTSRSSCIIPERLAHPYTTQVRQLKTQLSSSLSYLDWVSRSTSRGARLFMCLRSPSFQAAAHPTGVVNVIVHACKVNNHPVPSGVPLYLECLYIMDGPGGECLWSPFVLEPLGRPQVHCLKFYKVNIQVHRSLVRSELLLQASFITQFMGESSIMGVFSVLRMNFQKENLKNTNNYYLYRDYVGKKKKIIIILWLKNEQIVNS